MNDYRDTVKKGDVVVKPNGQLAIVVEVDIICAGHVMEVTLHSLSNNPLTRLFDWSGFGRYYDADIDRLKKVGSLLT